MKSILDYISEETNGNNYKSYKYCFENVEVPKLEYDDKQGIKVKKKLGNGYFGSSSATHIGQIVPLKEDQLKTYLLIKRDMAKKT